MPHINRLFSACMSFKTRYSFEKFCLACSIQIHQIILQKSHEKFLFRGQQTLILKDKYLLKTILNISCKTSSWLVNPARKHI